jgi:leucyl aminopeptidase (aminopeptidase T)
MLPLEPLTAALSKADAWVEYNNQWLLYSTPYDLAFKENKKLRHLNLVGMNASMMVRCIGRVDFAALEAFQKAFSALLSQTKHVRITTPAGEDVEFDHAAGIPVRCRMGYAHAPGSEMLAGQISTTPEFDSVRGTIVFDGSLVPPCGKLEGPIRLAVEKGTITQIGGGPQAQEFAAWVDGFRHPQMRRLAHLSYGFNPGARLSGDIVEDERVWGSTEWGIGSVPATIVPPGYPAPSHCDGVSLHSSVWLDGRLVMEKGRLVNPELVSLAAALGKA